MADTAIAPAGDDPFARLMASVPSDAGASEPAATPSDPFSRLMATTGAVAPEPQRTPLPRTSASSELSDLYTGLKAGVPQGVKDVLSSEANLADYLNKKFGLNSDLSSRVAAGLTQDRKAYEAQYGNMPEATFGRAVGDIAATAPLMAAGGEVLGVGGNLLTQAAPKLAPAVDFLRGTAGGTSGIGNRLLRYGSQGVNGAVQGATGAAIVSGGSDEPVSEQVARGAAMGFGLGVGMPATSDAFKGIGNALTGGGVDPNTAALAKTAMDKFGIPIRGGQISSSPFVKNADSVLQRLPFTGYAGKAEDAQKAFTGAVAKTFGEDATSLTPEVMQRAKTRIGQVFNDVAASTTIKADSQFVGDLSRVESEASQALPGSEYTPIKNQIDNILSKVATGDTIDGATYQALTRKGAPLDRAASSADPNVKFYAGQIRNALDDALERSAAPDDLNKLTNARLQWKNMRTVEDLAEKSGPSGQISPALLLNQVRKSYPNFAYTGAGDIGELAQIGQRFLKEPPSSGTAERGLVHKMLGLAGGTGEFALYLHDPALAGAVAGSAVGSGLAARGLGLALDNPIYRNSLLRSAARPTGPGFASAVGQYLRPYYIPASTIAINRLLPQSPAPSAALP